MKRPKIILIILGIVLLMAVLTDLSQTPESGTSFPKENPPIVVDGDTIKANGLRYRLLGVDTPEMNQQCKMEGICFDCGKAAKAFTEEYVTKHDIHCAGDKKDRYGRLLAICYDQQQQGSLNEALVAAGYGFVDPRYSKLYQSEQEEAKASKRGLWASDFHFPWEWRKHKQPCH